MPANKKKKRKAPARKKAGRLRRGRAASALMLVVLMVIGIAAFWSFGDNDNDNNNSDNRDNWFAGAEQETVAVNFFFRHTDGSWRQELRQIEVGTDDLGTAINVLGSLTDGPVSQDLQNAVPDGARVESLEMRRGEDADEGVLAVFFSASFESAEPLKQTFARTSFVWTFTELSFIDSLVFYIDGEPMLGTDGVALRPGNRANTALEDNLPPWVDATADVILYFTNEGATGLVAERRTIDHNPLHGIERAKIAALLAGPQSPGLFPILPSGISYNSIRVEGNTVIVDLNANFRQALGGGSLWEEMIVFSIVNTLTERTDIRQVQFLIDGLQITHDEESGLHIDLSRAIERDESLIVSE